MNNKLLRVISLIALVCLVVGCLCGCQEGSDDPTGTSSDATVSTGSTDVVDYAAAVTLDMSSGTLKEEVTVKGYVDGDTTHFYVDGDLHIDGGIIKARYLAVNTPESTGKIEEWGKKASNFTKAALSGATSIILETDGATLEADSTGTRYLLWVWYKPAGSDTYRNLNIELLQEGLAIASNSNQNRYGETCMAAIAQAKAQKLCVYSGQKDPDFYYGEAVPVTLKELRTNIEAYSNQKVIFTGTVTKNQNQTAYVQSYDEETGLYFGMTVYYGFNLSGAGQEMLAVGNELEIVGSVQYYEGGGSWQVADVQYRQMKPDDPNNMQLVSTGNEVVYFLTDAGTFCSTVELDSEDVTASYSYAQLALGTAVEMKDLTVVDVYTTTNEDSSSYGAMTLTCTNGNYTVDVRTTVFKDADGNLVTESAYMGKTIDVQGIVDYFSGSYQIKVFSKDDITVHE